MLEISVPAFHGNLDYWRYHDAADDFIEHRRAFGPFEHLLFSTIKEHKIVAEFSFPEEDDGSVENDSDV